MGERSEQGQSLKLPFREVSDKSHSFQRAALKHPVSIFHISWAEKLHFLSLQTWFCQGEAQASIRHSQILLTKWNNPGWSLTCKPRS